MATGSAAAMSRFASPVVASRLARSVMGTVVDAMNRDLITVDPSTTVAEAATIMGGKHVGSALVMEDDRLTGIFTERDIVRALGQHFDAAGHPVADWMTSDPTTVERDVSVDEALQTMLDRGFRHLPVVSEGKVQGVVSLRDLSRAQSEG